MPEQFLHGVEVVEVTDGSRAITTVKSSVIGLIGTAPDSQTEVKATLTTGSVTSNNSLLWTSNLSGELGNDIAVYFKNPLAASQALSVSVSTEKLITVSLATDASKAITTAAAQLIAAIQGNEDANALVTVTNNGESTGAGVLSYMHSTFLDGGVDEAFPLNTPVLVAGSRSDMVKLGTDGTLYYALDGIFDQVGAAVVVVRVAEGTTNALTAANIVGDGTENSGVYAFVGAESHLGVRPRILIAPGFTGDPTNGVVAEMLVVAKRLHAVVIADGPNTTDADVISYVQNYDSDRLYVVDPAVKVARDSGTVIEESSSRVAGLIAYSDNTRGFWWSPSNQVINGIIGVARAVDFVMGDENSRANILNENNVATIINVDGGYRLWGNRTLSSDEKYCFLCVRRTADIIMDSIQKASLWAVDRGITKTYLEDVAESVNGYLRTLKNEGAILGGSCWADPDLNVAANITEGKVYFDFDFTPVYPAEHVTFRVMLTDKYISELTSSTSSTSVSSSS